MISSVSRCLDLVLNGPSQITLKEKYLLPTHKFCVEEIVSKVRSCEQKDNRRHQDFVGWREPFWLTRALSRALARLGNSRVEVYLPTATCSAFRGWPCFRFYGSRLSENQNSEISQLAGESTV